nr:hypothetical protein [Tanacetum cinerariifolium]
MVAILEKGEFNIDFHPMVDFIAASPLRRNLKLRDEDGIVSIPDTELFENLTLMGARIAQSSALPTVAGEPASPVRDVSEREACSIESGLIVDQDRATIAKSSTLPHDSAPRAQEEEILRLKERVQVLEDRDIVIAKHSGDDAPIKGRSINERKAAAERISNDSEEVARVLTFMDAATVPARGIDVPTGSGSIPTAGPPATVISTGSEVGPTASPIVTSYSRRKGKEVMVESDTSKKQRLQEQIDAQVGMIDRLDRSNETIAKYLQEYQDFASELPLEKRIELISDLVKYQENYSKQVEDFIPMGSKEEAERLKKKGLNLEQEHVKKQKSSEEALEMEKSTEEKMKEMMQLVPVEDVYVQALPVKHPIIDWNVHTEGQRSYWKIIRQRDLHASRKRLSSQKRFSTCDDQLQASANPDDGEEGDGDNDDEDDDGEKGDDDDQEVERDDEKDDEEEGEDDEQDEDEGNGEEELGLNIGGEEGHVEEEEEDELYKDVNINQGKEEEEDELYRDININQGMGIQMTQEVKDSHVTLTLVNPDGMESIFETTSQMDAQNPILVAPLPMSAPTLTSSTIATITITQQAPLPPTIALSTLLQDLPNFGSLFGFNNRLRTLEANFFEFIQTNQFARAVSAILEIAQAENDEFLKTIDENMQKIIKEQVKEQVKTSYAVDADLYEMELKNILIEKMEGNKSIHQSNEQRNLYKALVNVVHVKCQVQ